MDFAKTFQDFLADPFDPNGDGKTSALELFAGVGLVLAIIFAWTHILRLIFGAS